jgi:hypothetical protein
MARIMADVDLMFATKLVFAVELLVKQRKEPTATAIAEIVQSDDVRLIEAWLIHLKAEGKYQRILDEVADEKKR